MSGFDRLGEMERRIRDYLWEDPGASNREVALFVGGIDPFGGLTVEFIVAWDDLLIGLHQRHVNN